MAPVTPPPAQTSATFDRRLGRMRRPGLVARRIPGGESTLAQALHPRLELLHAALQLLDLKARRDVERAERTTHRGVNALREAAAVARGALPELGQAGRDALPGLLPFAVEAGSPQLGLPHHFARLEAALVDES